MWSGGTGEVYGRYVCWQSDANPEVTRGSLGFALGPRGLGVMPNKIPHAIRGVGRIFSRGGGGRFKCYFSKRLFLH